MATAAAMTEGGGGLLDVAAGAGMGAARVVPRGGVGMPGNEAWEVVQGSGVAGVLSSVSLMSNRIWVPL